jgi:hypothetical protein
MIKEGISLGFVQILDETSFLLLRRSHDRLQLHKRKVEELHQNLANREIDIALGVDLFTRHKCMHIYVH